MTLRELLAMSEARLRDEWNRTSSLMALIANSQRDSKKTRAFKPSDFDPFQAKRPPVADMGVLKEMFVGKSVKEDK